MQIIYIGNFKVNSTEYYTRYAFRKLGHTVYDFPLNVKAKDIDVCIKDNEIDFILFAKPTKIPQMTKVMNLAKLYKVKTVCWIYDLYFDLPSGFSRKPEDLLVGQDVLVTTTPTNYWDDKIKHIVVRQGIHKPECFAIKDYYDKDVRFVGSMYGAYRPQLKKLLYTFYDFEWTGQNDEYRGIELNKLLGRTKIVVGDSVPYPEYWSNRLYEIVGRGGFLIMPEIDGIRQEIPSLVTYEYGNFDELRSKIDYYLKHDAEREEILMLCQKSMLRMTYEDRVKELLCKLQKELVL